jgi:hypothetical protein
MPQLAGSAISWQNSTLRATIAFAAELPAGQRRAVRLSCATSAPFSRQLTPADAWARRVIGPY